MQYKRLLNLIPKSLENIILMTPPYFMVLFIRLRLPFGSVLNNNTFVYEVHPCTSPLGGSFVSLNCSNSFQMNLSLKLDPYLFSQFHGDHVIILVLLEY